tara:strand:- start:212 stop:1282 length:1071 start_codon:yes stop_codon:yes gene_type:complete
MELNLFDGQKDLSEKEIKERYNSHMLAYLVSDYSTSLREIDDNFLEDLDVDEVVSEENEDELKDIIQDELTKVANTDLLDFFTGEVGEKLMKAGLIESKEDLQYRKTLSDKFKNKDVLEDLTVSNLTDSFIRGKLFGVERLADSEKEVEKGELRNAILNNNLKEVFTKETDEENPTQMQIAMLRENKGDNKTILDTHDQITDLYAEAEIKYTVMSDTKEINLPINKDTPFVVGTVNTGEIIDKLEKNGKLNMTHMNANVEQGVYKYDTFKTFRLEIIENDVKGRVNITLTNYTITPNIGRTRFRIPIKEGKDNTPEKLARLRIQAFTPDEIQKDLQEVLNVISRNYSTLNNEVRRI